jgi:hypothetical protein
VDADRLKEILDAGGLSPAHCGELRIEGCDPILATPFRAGEVAAVALGLSGPWLGRGSRDGF